MHFAYDGFTHAGDQRCFLFRCTDKGLSSSVFLIHIDLHLLVENKLPIQAAPMFCLKMLTAASQEQPNRLDRLRTYTVIAADFDELHAEQKRQAELKASKRPPRQPVRKPSQMCGLHLGAPVAFANVRVAIDGSVKN